MKLNISAAALLCTGLLTSTCALADNHTVSMGYAQSKVENFKDIRGINVQYRYEWDSPLSIIGSFSYMKGDDTYSESNDGGITNEYTGKVDGKYYSLLAGPGYRINDYVSLYALAGLAHTKVEDTTTWITQHSESTSESKTSFAYGAGVIVNPVDYLSVSIGYEGARVKYSENKQAINGFNVSIGYRF